MAQTSPTVDRAANMRRAASTTRRPAQRPAQRPTQIVRPGSLQRPAVQPQPGVDSAPRPRPFDAAGNYQVPVPPATAQPIVKPRPIGVPQVAPQPGVQGLTANMLNQYQTQMLAAAPQGPVAAPIAPVVAPGPVAAAPARSGALAGPGGGLGLTAEERAWMREQGLTPADMDAIRALAAQNPGVAQGLHGDPQAILDAYRQFVPAAPASAAAPAAPLSPYDQLMQNELDAAAQMYQAQGAQEIAQAETQRQLLENAQARSQWESEQNLQASMQGLQSAYGQLGTTRSGAFQAATAQAITQNTMGADQAAADYQAEIDRLNLEVSQGILSRQDAQIAQEQARIRAAYAMAQLGGQPSTGTPPAAA